jgi:sugar phosphate isomerase/epimerase
MTVTHPRVWVSTACLTGDRALPHVLARYHAMGLTQVEISAPHPSMPLDELAALIGRYQADGMRFIFHNYFPAPPRSIILNLTSADRAKRDAAWKIVADATTLARRTGVPLYGVHPGYLRDGTANESTGMFDFAGRARTLEDCLDVITGDFRRFYTELGLEAPGGRVFLALENLFPDRDGSPTSILCTLGEIERVIAAYATTDLGVLVDLAHLGISSALLRFDREEFLDRLLAGHGDRVYEVHLSDNDGRADLHRKLGRDTWALGALRRFKGQTRMGAAPMICLEPRGLGETDILDNVELVSASL